MDKELRLDEQHQYFKSRRYSRRLRNKKHKSREVRKAGLLVTSGRGYSHAFSLHNSYGEGKD